MVLIPELNLPFWQNLPSFSASVTAYDTTMMQFRWFNCINSDMSRKLPNYLKTYRKKCGFTQNEMALLLGCRSGANVSRYEHYKREPDLRTALACQVMFGIPANEIFPGIFAEVEQVTKERAMLLSRKLEQSPSTPLTLRKKDMLSRMTSGREITCRQNI